MIPAVVYGHGEEPLSLAVSLHEFRLALEHGHRVVEVESDSGRGQYLIKEVQYCHLQKDPIHVDLMRVDVTERVKVKVALEFRGDPAGLAVGGEVVHVMNDLEIECPLLEIPENIRVNIAPLNIGDAIHVRDIQLPAGVTSTAGKDDLVLSVRTKRTLAETPVAAAPTEGEAASSKEPEVIGRVAKETEGEQ
jgi:large subunit ribosomal protein L25